MDLNKISRLFDSYSPINESTINNESSDITPLSLNNGVYTDKNLRDTFWNWHKILFHNQDKVYEMTDKANKVYEKMLNYTTDIGNRINKLSTSAKGAALADRSNSKYTKIVYYTPTNKSYNPEDTTASVSNGKIFGVNNSDKFDSDKDISNSKITLEHIRCTMSDITGVNDCLIRSHDNTPIMKTDEIINIMKPFNVTGTSSLSGSKTIEFVVDRAEYNSFNNIQIKTEKPYVYTVYTSVDGVYYNPLNSDKILTNELDLSFNLSNDRYIKISVHFSRHTLLNNGLYNYIWDVSHIFIAMKKYKSETVFQSNDIDINTAGEYIAIDTCDNYENKNVSINYMISIDGGIFKTIKPLRAISRSDYTIRSLIPINDFIDNNVGVMTKFTESEGKYIYTNLIDKGMFESNIIRFYNGSNPFVDNGDSISITGIITKDKKVNLNDTVFINGVPFSGETLLRCGLVTIDVPKNKFNILFDYPNVEIVSYSNGTFIIKKDNIESTVYDRDYESNMFVLIVNTFDYILGNEITGDIEMDTKEDGVQLKTSDSVSKLYVLARSKYSSVKSVKIRADMKSLDSYTKPEITRIIFKVV